MKLSSKAKWIKIFNWFREYWYIPLGCVVVLILFLLLPQKKKVAHQIIEYMHKKEKRVREYNDAVDKETRKKITEVEKEKERLVGEIEKRYEKMSIDLSNEKKEEIKKELDKVKEDPKKLESWFNNYLSS
jgi:primosomal protein N'